MLIDGMLRCDRLPPTPEESPIVEDSTWECYERLVTGRWPRHAMGNDGGADIGWTWFIMGITGYDKDKAGNECLAVSRLRDSVLQQGWTLLPFRPGTVGRDILWPDDPELIDLVYRGRSRVSVGHVELPITKTDGLIARYNYRDDMVMTTMSTFQSLTVHCARCHDDRFR